MSIEAPPVVWHAIVNGILQVQLQLEHTICTCNLRKLHREVHTHTSNVPKVFSPRWLSCPDFNTSRHSRSPAGGKPANMIGMLEMCSGLLKT